LIELILGGARSGKSKCAEAKIRVQEQVENTQVIYLATATIDDDEMAARVSLHQHNRPNHWQLIEEPIYIAKILAENNYKNKIILIECLTLWLSNLLCLDAGLAEHSKKTDVFSCEKEKFLQQLMNTQANIIMVSNETGLGVVPMGALTRRFVDESGFLHQDVAKISNKVTLVVAGLEHSLK
jgi:adenosylcobinamide kinase/adenosylcobinamide-phosphate guanylyltransferase